MKDERKSTARPSLQASIKVALGTYNKNTAIVVIIAIFLFFFDI